MNSANKTPEVLVVGGGAGGIAVAASLRARSKSITITIVDPAEVHYYQPGWTLVGAGVFEQQQTVRPFAKQLPKDVQWIQQAVTGFEPEKNQIILDNDQVISYQRLIVAPGLKLDWDAIDGLSETLGKNGVSSNYRFDLAPYTWELVQNLKSGRALFTQPPMPIKCAGAPQKALYLSADYWLKNNCLDDIQIDFCNAGGVLFGVEDYVPSLMDYINKYKVHLDFMHNLVSVDGDRKVAQFRKTNNDGATELVSMDFDMIHVCPPQTAPDFVRESPLADAAGWVDVDQQTLQHKRYENIWSLGDVANTANAKTAAAVRKQAPVVAHNILASLLKDKGVSTGEAHYDGYGSCPLTVERGKVVLAEFGYGGKLLPSAPPWLLDGTKATRAAWFLKATMLPPIYWHAMLKGREWLAKPKIVK